MRDIRTLVLEFKDEVTAANGKIRSKAPGKGVLNAAISSLLFRYLESKGIKTHFIEYDGSRSLIVHKLEMIPLEVILRNYAYGSQIKRMPFLKPLQPLNSPLFELHLKDDELGDPLILPEDALAAGILTPQELKSLKSLAYEINSYLTEFFESKGLKLIDIKLEFGKNENNEIILGDELNGDVFRVINERGEHLDKEIYRKTQNVEFLLKAYKELAKRLGIGIEL